MLVSFVFVGVIGRIIDDVSIYECNSVVVDVGLRGV